MQKQEIEQAAEKAVIEIEAKFNFTSERSVGYYKGFIAGVEFALSQQKPTEECKCLPDETTGDTTVRCCNVCGKPIEAFWKNSPNYDLNKEACHTIG